MVTVAQHTQDLQTLKDELGILQNELIQLRGVVGALPIESLDRDLRQRMEELKNIGGEPSSQKHWGRQRHNRSSH